MHLISSANSLLLARIGAYLFLVSWVLSFLGGIAQRELSKTSTIFMFIMNITAVLSDLFGSVAWISHWIMCLALVFTVAFFSAALVHLEEDEPRAGIPEQSATPMEICGVSSSSMLNTPHANQDILAEGNIMSTLAGMLPFEDLIILAKTSKALRDAVWIQLGLYAPHVVFEYYWILSQRNIGNPIFPRTFETMFGCTPMQCSSIWHTIFHAVHGGDRTQCPCELFFALTKLTMTSSTVSVRDFAEWFGVSVLTFSVKAGRCIKYLSYLFDKGDSLARFEERRINSGSNRHLFSIEVFHARHRLGHLLSYEVGICITTGAIVWINGPFNFDYFSPAMIFASNLRNRLDESELVLARGVPVYDKDESLSHPFNHPQNWYALQILYRHEQIFHMFTRYQFLESYGGDPRSHRTYMRAAAFLVGQLVTEDVCRRFWCYSE